MKKALVLGASGGMGYAIVNELYERGIEVRAFARTRAKLEHLFGNLNNVEIFAGDAFSLMDLKAATVDTDLIFHAANIPYKEWEEKLALLMGNVLTVCKDKSLKLAVVDNIYAYGRSGGTEKINEQYPKNPHTKKGKIRLHNEKLIKDSGVQAFICHFPDFYGPNAENTILQYTLKNIAENKKAMFVGNQEIARESIFTPDGAKAIVNLAQNEAAYGQNWNIPGYGVITGKEIVGTLRELTGYQKRVSTVTRGMVKFLGLFSRDMREIEEMFYLNEEPVILNGEKYEKLLGPVPRTSYREGLQQTLEYLKGNHKTLKQ